MLADGSDPLEFVYKVCEAEDHKKRYKGAHKSVNQDVLDVLEELFFLQVIPSGKYHRGQQG